MPFYHEMETLNMMKRIFHVLIKLFISLKQNTFYNGKNRFQIAWDAFINPNSNNKFNEAIYKLIGVLQIPITLLLETLLTKGYGEKSRCKRYR